MKKLFVVFIILGFEAGAFAQEGTTVASGQFYWQLGTDFNTGLLAWGNPTGSRAEKTLTLGGSDEANNYLNNPVAGRGDYTYTPGYLDIFSYGSGKWLRGNELRLTIGYANDHIAFHTMSLLDTLVRADKSDGTGVANEFAPDHSLVSTPNSARTANWGDFLRYSMEEYYFRGKIGAFTGYVGNTPDRGKVNDFNTFTDDVLRTVKVENYGVITPDANADFLDDGQDTNNFMRSPRVRGSRRTGADNNDPFGWVDVPYFMVAADLGLMFKNFSLPLTIQIAADPGNNSGMNSGGGPDSRNDFDYKKMNGAFRISGESIADWVTFDAIYRFKGGDPNTLYSYDRNVNTDGIIQPDGLGVAAHTFGLYANILGVPDLGIGIGYSGYAKIFEADSDSDTETISKNSPFFSGIDLRAQYTGLDKLVITLANNVSFAAIRRSLDDPAKAMSVLGVPLPTGSSQRWIAVYNALGLDYQLSDQLTASFQIGNRYGVIDTVNTPLTGGKSTVTRSRNQLGGGAYIGYQLSRFFYLQGGITVRYLYDTYTNSDPAAQDNAASRDASGGMFDFAIPMRMRIVFGKI